MVPPRTKRVAVIGAGACGITAVKACKEENLEPICFEKTDNMGGLWRYRDEDLDGVASVMKSTVINNSKEMSAYSDFPPPKEFPNYMHNSKMVRYLEMYAEHFDVLRHILYKHEVLKVEPTEDYEVTGQWVLTIHDIENGREYTDIFDTVLVCIGHHSRPLVPEITGLKEFKGTIMHSHSYKKPVGFEDKTVLVVGVGNSGVDVAVELSSVSKKVYLSTRRGLWVIPRQGPKGLPFDFSYLCRCFMFCYDLLPYNLACTVAEMMINQRFHHSTFDIKPEHRIFSQHATVNDVLPNKLLSGTVIMKGDIDRFTENEVIFHGEEPKEIDAVVLCTGYKVVFPFLGEDICKVVDNKVDLYKYVFPPHLSHPTLAIIGLVQAQGALIPVMEMQCRWASRVFSRKLRLPPVDQMVKDIKKKNKEVFGRYVQSSRHTVQIDWISYMDEISSLIGAKPDLSRLFFDDPVLWMSTFFGPCLPYQYRLQGPNSWNGARNAILTVNERIVAPLKTTYRPPKGDIIPLEKKIIKYFFSFLLIAMLAFIMSVTI